MGNLAHSSLAALALVCTAPLAAQTYGNGSDGALAPLVDTVLDTTANGGVFQFTSITIPLGVTVKLVGSNPAILLCQGNATIAGTLTAQAPGSRWLGLNRVSDTAAGPGGYPGATTGNGAGPGGGSGLGGIYPAIAGSSASHATVGSHMPWHPPGAVYGATLPFDLRGGSGGGAPSTGNLGDYGPLASGGGGTIVLLADGPISVTGAVNARGGDHVYSLDYATTFFPATGGLGSGGSILLRSLQCVQVTGRLDARSGTRVQLGQSQPTQGLAGCGFIRIDSYSACGAPQVTGADIQPAPQLVSLPHLTQLAPARIGQTLPLRVASAPGDVVGFYYSLASVQTPVPPFGTLELDPSLILFFGQHVVPTTGHDPLAPIDIPVPFLPGLVGVTLHAQVFNAFGTITGAARLSNRLTVTIGS